MNFLALLVGLSVERLLTHLFHLREFYWLDRLFDAVFSRLRGQEPLLTVVVLAMVAVSLTAPAAYFSVMLTRSALHIPYFVFAVLVLLFCLGPRDLKEEVEEYCSAAEDGTAEDLRQLADELLEREAPDDPDARTQAIERAIYEQANNRIFGVVFWFVLLGPTGAWLFRVMDLMRHRAAHRYAGEESDSTRLIAARALHGVLAWVPSRLLAAGYVLAGSFDGAVTAWRQGPEHHSDAFFERTGELLSRVGKGSCSGAIMEPGDELAAPRAAIRLVMRTLWLIWYPVIALLTLTNLLR
jgi:membrane protein required for beta-lactamase induction